MLGCGNIRSAWAEWRNFFSEEQIEKVKDLKKEHSFERGVVWHNGTLVEALSTRKSNIFFVNRTPSYEWLFSHVEDKVAKVNRDFFNFDLYPIKFFQYTQYTVEDEGFYDWHWDSYTSGEVETQRKISISIQLSDCEDYEGGVLELAPSGNLTTAPKGENIAIFFPSFVNHRVSPITKGTRESLVFWVEGPDWK